VEIVSRAHHGAGIFQRSFRDLTETHDSQTPPLQFDFRQKRSTERPFRFVALRQQGNSIARIVSPERGQILINYATFSCDVDKLISKRGSTKTGAKALRTQVRSIFEIRGR
jgi:hypothetical protein